MTGNSKLDLLVGRYFLAPFPHDEQGIVEAVVDDGHCLVRFEADGAYRVVIGVPRGSLRRASSALAVSRMHPWESARSE